MAGKKKTPPPIDRPLSRAYVRQFMGWSTAYPPGQSEPNSVRFMENVTVDRNGALVVRPGLHYLSYEDAPDLDPVQDDPGRGLGLEVVGAPELFYLGDGSRALLFAVRENITDRVGFRVILFSGVEHVVYRLTDDEVGFSVPQGEDVLSFDPETSHVEYVQINNRILALSDNGEAARLFWVGAQKMAKKLNEVSVPQWYNAHKLTVVHPEAAWVDKYEVTSRTNTAYNPSFEIGTAYWSKSDATEWNVVKDGTAESAYVLEITSAPMRTNMVPSPIHDVVSTGTVGWRSGAGSPVVAIAGSYLQASTTDAGEFFVDGPRCIDGVEYGQAYTVTADITSDPLVAPRLAVTAYSANGAELSRKTVLAVDGRFSSSAIYVPQGTKTLRVSIGGHKEGEGPGSVRYKNLVLCREGESTEMFTGNDGADYFWTDGENTSSSVYHPAQDIQIESMERGVRFPDDVAGSMDVSVPGNSQDVTVGLRLYDGDLDENTATEYVSTVTLGPGDGWTRVGNGGALVADQILTRVFASIPGVARGDTVRLDNALLELDETSIAVVYFDGSVPALGDTLVNSWEGAPHESKSTRIGYSGSLSPADPETPTADTLIAAGGAANNDYKVGLFYTFENEVGESMPSQITETRIQRPWSNWIWETPNASGEPSGTDTSNENACADQLVANLPEDVFDQAVAEGAIRWNLYAFTWSDQEPVPVIASLVKSQDILADQATEISEPQPYSAAGWISVTPARRAGIYDTILPAKDNRLNSSTPPHHRNGTVAGDRMILIGAPTDAATIYWSSSQAGQYTDFTPNKGGGRKTLSSGNLNLPYSVLLWQNPQSVDTLTILSSDDNGRSTSYYMQPATIQGGNTGLTNVMGFEETTNTPGTVSPFGAEVLNNALYRPLDRSLLKSTASNYNINHKPMTDKIANMWWLLETKQWIMSTQLDRRLYYLVHNPQGELLEKGCKGNELWIYDMGSEAGSWSRLLIQGSALATYNVGARTYAGISRPEGLYYLDPEKHMDDYVALDGTVQERPIPWSFETNTQGANRAHDAWAHLQQIGVTFGNFKGSVEYGVRGQSMNGRRVEVSKIYTDTGERSPRGQTWDVEDMLLIRRDMKEWYFWARSLPDTEGTGQIGLVQYRYTPVTVNVGFEFGSVETFEYGTSAGTDGTPYSQNGIPRPYIDYGRP